MARQRLRRCQKRLKALSDSQEHSLAPKNPQPHEPRPSWPGLLVLRVGWVRVGRARRAYVRSTTLGEIVTAFIRDYRRLAQNEADEFRRLWSLDEAIRNASLCHWLPRSKRHPHQRRIPGALLAAVEKRFQACNDEISHAANFEALHEIVDRETGGMCGIGDLTVYDIAHRIGAFLGKAPNLVYLHAGARLGAGYLGLNETTADPSHRPDAFSDLTAAEIGF